MDNETKNKKLIEVTSQIKKLAPVSDVWANKDNQRSLDFKTIGEETATLLSIPLSQTDRTRTLVKQEVSQTELTLKIASIDGKYRRLKYCLSEQERLRIRLKDVGFSIQRLVLQNQETLESIDRLKKKQIELDDEYKRWVSMGSPTTTLDGETRLEKEILQDITTTKRDLEQALFNDQEESSSLVDKKEDYEARLKELSLYQQVYTEIRVNLGIPEDWDEQDFEQDEYACLVRKTFKQAAREILSSLSSNISIEEMTGVDVANGPKPLTENIVTDKKSTTIVTYNSDGMISQATMEDFEFIGVPPQEGLSLARLYVNPKGNPTPWGNTPFYIWVTERYKDTKQATLQQAGIQSNLGPMVFKENSRQDRT